MRFPGAAPLPGAIMDAGSPLIAAVMVAALVAAYGPGVRHGILLAMRLTQRRCGLPARRQLVQAAVESAAHLTAMTLILLALLAAGQYGRTVLAHLSAAVIAGVRQPALTISGAAVGVAEAGLAALTASAVLASVRAWLPRPAVRGGIPAGPARAPGTASTAAAWLSLPRSGWARRWPRPGDAGPAVMASLVLLAGVAAEETVFRGLLITTTAPLGGPAAVAVAGAAYLAYGLTRPAARGSRVEATSCCVVFGVVNGVLFWLVPALLPIVVAQLAFVMFIG